MHSGRSLSLLRALANGCAVAFFPATTSRLAVLERYLLPRTVARIQHERTQDRRKIFLLDGVNRRVLSLGKCPGHS